MGFYEHIKDDDAEDYPQLQSHPALYKIKAIIESGQLDKERELNELLLEDDEHYGELYGKIVYVSVVNDEDITLTDENNELYIDGDIDFDSLKKSGLAPTHVRLNYVDQEFKQEFKCVLSGIVEVDSQFYYTFYIDPASDDNEEKRLHLYTPVDQTFLSFQNDELYHFQEELVKQIQGGVSGHSRRTFNNIQQLMMGNAQNDLHEYFGILRDMIKKLYVGDFNQNAWYALELYLFNCNFPKSTPVYIDTNGYRERKNEDNVQIHENHEKGFQIELMPEGILLEKVGERFIPYIACSPLDDDGEKIIHIPFAMVNDIDPHI